MSRVEAMTICPASYPCPNEGQSQYKGNFCSQGHYCPPGTATATGIVCPEGTFSSSYYATSDVDCIPCLPGFACVEGTIQIEDGDACTIGYYCPRGTVSKTQYPCPAGTVRTTTGARRLEDCLPCSHGYYCTQATPTMTACPAGYYCPLGTKSDHQYPCRAGTYDATGSLRSQEECLQCGLGNYCIGQGQIVQTPCAEGYYNDLSEEASECHKCLGGYKCTGTGTVDPVICAIGYYSDEGAADCTQCEKGYYCPVTGISAATKLSSYQCLAGMLCVDTDYGLTVYPDLESNACPAGSYCPIAAIAPIGCPKGTYNPVAGRGSLADCLPTIPGYYTDTVGSTGYSSNTCTAGYFCLSMSSTATQYPCPPGTYSGNVAAASPLECVPCPSGSYCLSATAVPADCPQGFYCPTGTSKPEACPEGTYSSTTKLFDSRSCLACLTGKFCYRRNQTAATDDCDEGFFCIGGSKRPEPTDSITGKACPRGGYCVAGTTSPASCPAGKYMAIEGAIAVTQCIPCPAGSYCLGTNSPLPSGSCDPGFYCEAGSAVSNPVGKQSAQGYYAPSGSEFQLKCPRGKYSNQAGKAQCDECGGGYKCTNVGMSTRDTCPKGFYCPPVSSFGSSNTYDIQACPRSTYNDQDGRASAIDCMACPAGHYCPTEGMNAAPGDPFKCNAGFYCAKSAYSATPEDDAGASKYGACPVGKFCTLGVSVPLDCPSGTYSSNFIFYLTFL